MAAPEGRSGRSRQPSKKQREIDARKKRELLDKETRAIKKKNASSAKSVRPKAKAKDVVAATHVSQSFMMKTVDFAKEAMKSRQSHGIKGKENRPPQLVTLSRQALATRSDSEPDLELKSDVETENWGEGREEIDDDEVDISDEEDLQPQVPRTAEYFKSTSLVLSDVSRSPRKRSHRDVSDSENGDSDIIEIPPPKVTKIIDNKGRPRQKSYDNEVRDVIKLAIDITKVKLVTHNPFPMNAEEEEMIKDSWEQACFQFGVMFGMTLDIYKLLGRTGTHFCSSLKETVRSVVSGGFGFRDGHSLRIKSFNEKLYNKWHADTSYIYPLKELDKPKLERRNMYRHPSIGTFINKAFFPKLRSIGIRFSDAFAPHMPLVTIAFTITFIEFALGEWSTGSFTDTTLSESALSEKYTHHLADLKRFKELTDEHGLFEKIATKLLTNAMDFAGAPSYSLMKEVGRIDDEVFRAACQNYVDGSMTESDGDETELENV
ncbi:hypothetical protein NLI96_g11635 [Meripilus lineatus]|uniref:DUF6532 domain-containing protein n=1 Tax=Meripilus lineatus TaxID=2056292 RepID=A0AAD5URF6_9APHY|nr:hypothetical protein NLI96_g11635 [Physisporinus lineatus]